MKLDTKPYFITILLLAVTLSTWGAGTDELPSADPVTVTLLQVEVPTEFQSFRDGGLHSLILDRFGVDLQFEFMSNDALNEMLAVTTTSGLNMPDVVSGLKDVSIGEVNRLGSLGLLYPIDKLMDVAPELAQFYDRHPAALAYSAAPDGHMYYIPSGYDSSVFYEGIAVRKDLLDQVDFELNSVDSFEDHFRMLRALMIANEGKPVVGTGSGVQGLLAMPFKSVGLDHPSRPFFDEESNRFVFPYATEEARFAIGWVRRLYEEGIIDQNVLTQTRSAWLSDMSELVYPALLHDCIPCYAYPSEAGYEITRTESVPNFVAVRPPMYRGKRYPWRSSRVGDTPGVVLSSVLSPHRAKRIMTMLDWFRSVEGHATAKFGVRGQDWELIDGVPRQLYHFPENEYVFTAEWQAKVKPWEDYKLWEESWENSEFFGSIIQKEWEIGDQWLKDPERSKYVWDFQEKYDDIYTRAPAPIVNFHLSNAAELPLLHDRLFSAAYAWVTKVISGEVHISQWHLFQEYLLWLGLDQYEHLINNDYFRGSGSREPASVRKWAGFLPSPTTSSRVTIHPERQTRAAETTFADVDDAICSALEEHDLEEKTYYRYGDGFLLVSELQPYACDTNKPHNSTFSFADIIAFLRDNRRSLVQTLIETYPGIVFGDILKTTVQEFILEKTAEPPVTCHRVVVFVVNSDPPATNTENDPASTDTILNELLAGGSERLFPDLKENVYGSNFGTWALMYSIHVVDGKPEHVPMSSESTKDPLEPVTKVELKEVLLGP